MGNRGYFLKTVLAMAIGLGLSTQAMAGNNDGAVVGHTQANATVTVTNPATGLTRTIVADEHGNYRFPFLPVGQYTLTASSAGKTLGEPRDVTVSLGNTTTVDVGTQPNVKELASVNVAGSILPVIDVTSTESATNLTHAQLQRLPVEQNVASVVQLAPGVVKGNAGFGGISFGGSSIAENAFYVNGLNVTDFYNRNGFSEAPFDFYQEFQVKTGGYSVQFGRTTGGVVNAVARSGTNTFKYGITETIEPDDWRSAAQNRYDASGNRYITADRDGESLYKTNLWASGPIIKGKLFFFAMYERRQHPYDSTDDLGEVMNDHHDNNGFWGATIDWNITDKNTLSLMAFSDKDRDTADVYEYDYGSDTRGKRSNIVHNQSGGRNWALTWSSYLTNDLSMKLMFGRNQRMANTVSQLDQACNRVVATNDILAEYPPGAALGCTTSSTVYARTDTRTQYRADFEWTLGSHLLRFGYDHEKNVSVYAQHYAGPDGYYYNVYAASPGSSIPNGGVVPPGYDGYVRARQYVIAGTFPSINSAVYLEDNWSVTPNFVINAGVRNDSFNNEAANGASYIKITKQIAPRLGFSWDVRGDASMKLFGNLGRYYLPVANVINIKQAGGLLDRRTYYAFGGWETLTLNGVPYVIPKLGPQLGAVDESQGNGTVGDFRSEVSRHMDPVYQDEAILGFQQLLTPQWSWGVSGIYRRMHNAIDDMQISATPQCGGNGYVGWVMANPGKNITVWGDTGDVRRRWQLPWSARLGETQAHLWRHGIPGRSRLGRQVVAQRLVHDFLEPRQRGRSGEFRHRFCRYRAHRELGQPVRQSRQRFSAQRSPPSTESARHLCADAALATGRRSQSRLGRADHQLRRGQPVRCHQLLQLLHLRGQMRVHSRAIRCRRQSRALSVRAARLSRSKPRQLWPPAMDIYGRCQPYLSASVLRRQSAREAHGVQPVQPATHGASGSEYADQHFLGHQQHLFATADFPAAALCATDVGAGFLSSPSGPGRCRAVFLQAAQIGVGSQ
jgi:hypothetical protein